jgi:penicillin amidase
VVLNVKITRHGPVNDLIDGLKNDKPVALSWIYPSTIQILDAVYELSHAKKQNGFSKGVALILGLNVMYGDAKGTCVVGYGQVIQTSSRCQS